MTGLTVLMILRLLWWKTAANHFTSKYKGLISASCTTKVITGNSIWRLSLMVGRGVQHLQTPIIINVEVSWGLYFQCLLGLRALKTFRSICRQWKPYWLYAKACPVIAEWDRPFGPWGVAGSDLLNSAICCQSQPADGPEQSKVWNCLTIRNISHLQCLWSSVVGTIFRLLKGKKWHSTTESQEMPQYCRSAKTSDTKERLLPIGYEPRRQPTRKRMPQ